MFKHRASIGVRKDVVPTFSAKPTPICQRTRPFFRTRHAPFGRIVASKQGFTKYQSEHRVCRPAFPTERHLSSLNSSMDAVFLNHFKELVVIAVIHRDPNDNRPAMVQRFLQDGTYLIRSPDHPPGCTESLGIFKQ